MAKAIYRKPEIVSHQPIKFETHVSGNGGGGGDGGKDCPSWWDNSWGNWEDFWRHHHCFITTACVKAKGLPDDCEELEILRHFRDTELRTTAEGRALVERYYEIAPKILWEIDQENDSTGIYHNLYDNLVVRSVEFIKEGKMTEAKMNYMGIVEELEQKYLIPIKH